MAVKFNLPRRGARVEWRVFFLAFLVLLGLGGLVLKLWWEQVARGPMWAKKIAGRSEVTVRIPSVRGEIRDRNGIPLVTNRASYEVDFYLPDMVRGYKQQNQHTKIPTITYRGSVKGMAKDKAEADIVQIVNTNVIPRLQDLDLASDYNSEHLRKHYRNDTEVPFAYREEIDFKTLARFSEHDVGLPGVDIAIRPVRQYVYGALAAHLLGYVGMPNNIDELPDVRNYSFYQPDVEGKSQIEASMEKYLRGTPGVRVLQRSVKGQIEGESKRIEPQPGANVYLTLDARIQYIVEQALRHPALGRAAAVVVDVNNGDILAMGTVPSFDPNIFIPSVSERDWKALHDDPAVPLVSRAVSAFPPGSTFKIITAMGGFRKNIENSRWNCPGGIQYGDHYFKCWIAGKGTHGTIGLAEGLKVSCDCYFYQYGNAAGIENIDRIGKIVGIGEHYDIGLADEKSGNMPGPEWMRMRGMQEKWTSAQTANTSIGQGYVLASPLQMAMAYATVANGGIAYEPRLVKTVLSSDGRPALDENGQTAVPDQPKIRGNLLTEFSRTQLDIVRNGLWKVVNEGGGTGGRAKLKGVTVAGKTGTAQATDRGKEENIGWFCCYAPYEKPRYAMCVMIQAGEHGGHGGTIASPVAAHILEQIFAMDEGAYEVPLARLEPAHSPHPFGAVTAVDYKNAEKFTLAEESNDNVGDRPARPDMGNSNAHPDIRPEADEAGKVKARPKQAPPQKDTRNVFERLFGIGRKPAPAPPPGNRAPINPFRPGGR